MKSSSVYNLRLCQPRSQGARGGAREGVRGAEGDGGAEGEGEEGGKRRGEQRGEGGKGGQEKGAREPRLMLIERSRKGDVTLKTT